MGACAQVRCFDGGSVKHPEFGMIPPIPKTRLDLGLHAIPTSCVRLFGNQQICWMQTSPNTESHSDPLRKEYPAVIKFNQALAAQIYPKIMRFVQISTAHFDLKTSTKINDWVDGGLGRKGLWFQGWSLQRAAQEQSPTSVSGHLVLFRPRTVSRMVHANEDVG